MPYKVALFDLDGTLCDTYKDISFVSNYVLNHFGYGHLNEETIKSYIGSGARVLLERCFKGKSVDLNQALSVFLEKYFEVPIRETVLFEGVAQTLNELSGIKKIVFTNKPEQISIAILKKLNVLDKFERVIGGDTYEFKKPDPRPINILKLEFKLDYNDFLMVGDSITDVKTAKAAGIRVCGASYGYGNPVELELADYKIDKFGELKQIILGA